MITVTWSQIKDFSVARKVSLQWVETDEAYHVRAYDGLFALECLLLKRNQNQDLADFESSFKATSNQSPMNVVTTQYERDNKDLKLAKIKSTVTNGQAIATLKVPGNFGAENEGRYVAGGYALLDTFDADDYITVYVEDTDRLIAQAYGAGAGLERALTDEEMQGQGDFPMYPIVKSYTDDEIDPANQGWFFWPVAMGGNLPPMGEVEVEPIGGYGFLPAGLYIKLVITRPNVQIGTVYTSIFWGKLNK